MFKKMMSKNNSSINELRQDELEWLSEYKKMNVNIWLDEMHDYAVIKNAEIENLAKKYEKNMKNLSHQTKNSQKNNLSIKDKVVLWSSKMKNDVLHGNKDHEQILEGMTKKFQTKKAKLSLHNSKKIENHRKRKKAKIARFEKFMDRSIENVNSLDKTTLLAYRTSQYLRPYRYLPMLAKTISAINKNKLLLVIAIISIFAGATEQVFFSKRNILTNIIKNNAEVGIMAVGMTFVILTGGIDLSVGSLLGMLGILIAKGYTVDGYSLSASIIIGLLATILVGIFQGLIIAKLKLPPFIVTLVGLLGFRGIARIFANSKTFLIENDSMKELNIGDFIGIPYIVWILIGVVIIGMIILKLTKFGKNVYATGGNVEAARLSGVKTWSVIMMVYIISALTVFVATISYASRVGSFSPLTGSSYELDVISAVVLGGTSLTGGKGGVGKTIIGWLVISTLSNVMLLLGYSQDWQLVFKGIIILIAVILDKNYNILWRMKKLYKKIF